MDNLNLESKLSVLQGGNRISTAEMPFVSIITVVYNSEKLLENTVKSVTEQTSADYEYLVLDGNSKDGTLAIIQNYDLQINYWQSEPDQGLYDAMNKGLTLARGKYVLFLNSGDLLNSADTIALLKEKSKDADIIFGETNLIDSTGKILGTRSQLTTRKLPKVLTWKSLMQGMVVSHQSILVKKAIAPRFDTAYRCSADIDWVISALKQSKHTINSELIVSRYLIGGFSGANAKLASKERFQIFMQHYGLISAICAYIFIVFRSLIFKLRGKSNY